MKVKSKQQLEAIASNIFQDLEKTCRPCETVYVLSRIQETLSLVMLQQELRGK